MLLLLDARRPVANFGYEGGSSQLVALPVGGLPDVGLRAGCLGLLEAGRPAGGKRGESQGKANSIVCCCPCLISVPPLCRVSTPTPLQDEAVWEFDSGAVNLPAALRLLAEEVGGGGITPQVNCRGAFCSAARPPLPKGEQPLAACPRRCTMQAGGNRA